MVSNPACVGLDVEDESALADLLGQLSSELIPLGRLGAFEVARWEDASGARLLLELKDGAVIDLLPSFAGRPSANLGDVRAVNEAVCTAGVFDDDGEQLTAAAFELEQRRLLASSDRWSGLASVTALGNAVTVHADESAFAASDASLLSPDEDEPSEPPPHFVEAGWPWPPRIAAESFISYGVFGNPEAADARARLAGTVLSAQRCAVELTGQHFTTARVRTCGFEIDVCLGPDHATAPEPGQVVAGEVFLVASLDHPQVETTHRRRRFLPWRRSS